MQKLRNLKFYFRAGGVLFLGQILVCMFTLQKNIIKQFLDIQPVSLTVLITFKYEVLLEPIY